MKYVVAVSGGVDSVVLLDALARENAHEIIVAHFDHGIRDDSAADARFVAALAKTYGLKFVSTRENLGESASENVARARRYTFLREQAKMHNATIVTAHHLDDLVETIAINFSRGTGWRGLAAFGDQTIYRPFLSIEKSQLYDYALKHNLEWVEDSTNCDERYLRNRLRKRNSLPLAEKMKLYELWQKQRKLSIDISHEINQFEQNSRYFFIMIDEAVALEILRTKTHEVLTRPQLRSLLLAIKTAKPHAKWRAGSIDVTFSKRDFVLENHHQR